MMEQVACSAPYIVARLQTGARYFSVLQSIKISLEAHPAPNSMNTRGSYLGVKQLGCEASHVCLVVRLRISAAVLVLSLYAFLTCTGTT
jgi:hypothetical protein